MLAISIRYSSDAVNSARVVKEQELDQQHLPSLEEERWYGRTVPREEPNPKFIGTKICPRVSSRKH